MTNLVSIKARTRGKGPKDFTYMGLGKSTARRVKDSNGNDLVVDAKGEPVTYILMGTKVIGKDRTKTLIPDVGVTEDKDGYVLGEGLAYVTVDDVDVSGVFPESGGKASLEALMARLAEYSEKAGKTPFQMLLDCGASGYNDYAREAVAPKAEEKPDELGEIVAQLVAAKLISDKQVGDWRRRVSMGAGAMEISPLAFAEGTALVKALRASQLK